MGVLLTDDELLAATRADPDAFGEFYARHERLVLGFMLRRAGEPELAADLTAETFARALQSAHRFKPGPEPAVAWLLGIAQNVLAMTRRRGRVEARARARLGIPSVALDDMALLAIVETAGTVEQLLTALPEDQQRAVRARIIEQLDYPTIASELACSEATARQRVSRGLAALRRSLEARS